MKKEEIEDLMNEWEEEDGSEGLKIDWLGMLQKLWNRRKFISLITGSAFAIGLIMGLTTTRMYTVNVLLAPEFNATSLRSGSMGSIASMLGMGGMQGMGSTDAYSVSTYPQVISSTPFLTDMFDLHVSDPSEGIDTTLVGYLTRDTGAFSLKAFIKSLLPAPEPVGPQKALTDVDLFHLTKAQTSLVKYLCGAITASVDKKTGETAITVQMDNPVIAAQVADFVCANLRKYIINYRTGKAQEDYSYYQKLADESKIKYDKACIAYANYQDLNKGLVLHKVMSEGTRLQNEQNLAYQVYAQMAQQAVVAKAKVQEQKPVFAVIEPATVPLRPSNSRKVPVLILTFLGGVGSVAWVLFLKDFWEKIKEVFREIKGKK